MELEEMQTVWSELSDQIEKQKKLTDKMIIMMTQEKYRSRINRIAYPEILGGIICYGAGLLIVFNFSKLDNWYSLLCGIISIVVLFVLPILSLKSIKRIHKIDVATNNYKETLLNYAKEKKQFQKVMKWGYYLGFIIMFTIMPVTSKIINGKDLFSETKSIWPLVIAIPLAIIFFIVFSKWVFKHYLKNINSAESLIKDLETTD